MPTITKGLYQIMKKLLFIFFTFVIIIAFLYMFKSHNTPTGQKLTINNNTIYIEIADTPEKREQGLMYRKDLCKDCGMLFVFENEDIYTFWMKNTYISLDIIWISNTGEIVEIAKNTKPYICHLIETSEDCKPSVYKPHVNSRYVLEVNGGFSEKNNIQVGDRVQGLKNLVSE